MTLSKGDFKSAVYKSPLGDLGAVAIVFERISFLCNIIYAIQNSYESKFIKITTNFHHISHGWLKMIANFCHIFHC